MGAIRILRFLIKDAGHIERLALAVRIASEVQGDDQKLLWEAYIRLFAQNTSSGIRKKGLRSPRSAQPHLSFARELDLLEWRNRWVVSPGAGRTFLLLWDAEGRRPPKAFLLRQFLKFDSTFSIPFLKMWLEERRRLKPAEIAKRTWELLWRRYGAELASVEPPLPRNPSKSTCYHHALARLRFLTWAEGLALTIEQIERLVQEFEQAELESDQFFRLGRAVAGGQPEPLPQQKMLELLTSYSAKLKHLKFLSAESAFAYVNEHALPNFAVNWNDFLQALRGNPRFSIHPSFRAGDLLFCLREL
jgi:hypothetical protein